MQNIRIKVLALCALLVTVSTMVYAAPARERSFQDFLSSLYQEAAELGVSRETFDRAFAGITEPHPGVLKKAAYQPEFTTEIWDYLEARVNSRSVDDGRVMAKVYAKILHDVEKRFGIEAPVLLAIWSMESSYGAALRRPHRLYYVPTALATLAYADKKRQKFARKQLMAVLQILQSGDIEVDGLRGSWAGAMGHTQFIPTSYLAYGVDMDGDGRRDIWNSIPDALATAANLLSKNKWRTGKIWGYEVQVPENWVDHIDKSMSLDQWQKLGFVRPSGENFPNGQEQAELKMIAGSRGPGFLVLRNFFVLKRYNNSDFYALAVGLLADRLSGRKALVQQWQRPERSLSRTEKLEIQSQLKKRGLYLGEIDGIFGDNTKAGIRDFQRSQGLFPDGEPSPELLEALTH